MNLETDIRHLQEKVRFNAEELIQGLESILYKYYQTKRDEPVLGKVMIHFNWDKFADKIENCHSKPFGSVFSSVERERVKYLADVWADEGYTDLRHLAYACATVRKECGPNFMPVREGGWNKEITDAEARHHVRNRWYGKEINGHVYYGRGYVQLSLYENYLREGIADNPDKALNREWSAKLLFKGLLDGRWNGRGKGLMYYLDKNDPVQARRTVNVLDDAHEVAEWYQDFLEAFEAARIV
jgi:hypothetical protein